MTPDLDSSGKPLRVALIGCGKMGLQHIRAIDTVPGATVVGVADPNLDPATLVGLVPAATKVYSDVAAMLSETRPDVVHVVTPPATHARLAKLALDAGCHLYIEKPFTQTRAEAEEILTLAAQRGLQVCAGHQYLFEGPSRLALQALPEIGRLVHVESYFSFRMVRRTISPVEQAIDILPHAVYPLLAQLRAGTGLITEPVEVTGIEARAEGDVYALLRLGDSVGILVLTLSGRPVEQYQHLVGSQGWLRADYVTGSLTRLLGPGAGLGVLFTPYRRALQTLGGATKGIIGLLRRKTSYPGLTVLVSEFYASIQGTGPVPLSPRAILDTVDVCERIGVALHECDRQAERVAQSRLGELAAALPAAAKGLTLVTGGTGLLGRRVAEELRWAGFGVRVLARRQPPWSRRVAGVEYVNADLASRLDPAILSGVDLVVHCAAETAGGEADHQRNSIDATRHVVEAAAQAGVKKIIHISSLAVLKLGRDVGGPLDESTPIDSGHKGRGPYVWGKAESEVLVAEMAGRLGLDIKIIRPGPLVDYTAFQPPGRLGRELGPVFVAVGPSRSALSVCDVGTAARVIRSYAERYADAPRVLNMVEAPPPTRRELASRMLQGRPDLTLAWLPAILLRLMSGPLKMVQRVFLKSATPIDVYGAFASERYQTQRAETAIRNAGPSAVPLPETLTRVEQPV